ncbi:MAG: M81 family metallopeptidase [Chloroflexi bacterium]|nr:M81 family metallopeptidase [Chloroflexota bacterium]
MRVAIGGFLHETNTFHPTPTTLADFRGPVGHWLFGEEIVSTFAGTRGVIGGFLDGCQEADLAAVPTFFAQHPPTTGTLTAEAFDTIRENLVAGVRTAGADAVLLHLHGAAVAANAVDPEAVVLREVREAIGPRVPIVVVYDLHANIGTDWAARANAIIGYKTAPHVDFYERGREGAEVTARILRGEVRPVVAVEKPPIMIKAGLMSMTDAPLALIKPPMFWLASRAREIERDPRIVNVSIAAGFGDADTPVTGMTILVNADADLALAAGYARELADLAWKLRRGFLTDLVLTPVEVAIARALATPDWPVILADQGNNTAGGSPGDGTAILAGLKAVGWPDAALFIRDEESVRQVWAAGVGAEVELRVGGKHEPTNGEPVPVSGVVRLLTDGLVRRAVGGTPARLGKTAVVRSGETDLVLTEHPSTQTGPQFFRAVGIEPRERRIVVVQSAHLFRHAFEVQERIPKMIIEVDTPGITSPNVARFTYRHVRRPIFPLDDLSG